MEPHARIEQGEVEGAKEGGVFRFLGLPFAEPPLGELRWRAPRPPAVWDGGRDATRFGSICPQVKGASFDTREHRQSEDCLYLNVWTPALGVEEKRPVMVWIHGGGYLGGSGSEDASDGTRLAAAHGVVVVTFNYRLGAFGFASHPGIDANIAILDQVAALRWVAANIAALGGDPDNVTIFGQSAGAHSVRTLLSVAQARGLFHRAVLESGGFEEAAFVKGPGFDHAAATTRELFAQLGSDDVPALRQVPAEKIAALSFKLGISPPPGQVHTPASLVWMPTVDGEVVSVDGFPGWAEAVPLLLCYVDNEARYFVKPEGQYPPPLLQKMAGALAGDRAAEVGAILDKRHNGDTYAALDELMTTAVWREPALASLERFTALGRRVHHCQFGRVSPARRMTGELATHTAEIRYIFGNLALTEEYDDTDAQISDIMSTAWTAFARTGIPTLPGGTRWPHHATADPRLTRVTDTAEIIHYVPTDLTKSLQALRSSSPA